jgi:hypothetical protein
MKRLLNTLCIVLLICPITFGQNAVSGSDNFIKAKVKNSSTEDFFEQNIMFPKYILQESGNVNVIVSFLITKEGKIDSVKILKSPKKEATLEALSVLDKSDNLWEPTKVNGQPVNWRYIASFKFVTSLKYDSQKKKIQKLIQKNSYDNALELIAECFKFHEYDTELYQLRSSVYTKTNKPDLANQDLEKIKFIEQNLIVDLWVTAIGIPRTISR